MVMGDFSQSPLEVLTANLTAGYAGLHIEQGVPILDRDLNLLHDLLAEGMRAVFAAYLGDGAAAGADAFRITATTPPAADLTITGGGSLLLNGLPVRIAGTVAYSAQPWAPPTLSTPGAAQPDPRADTVYLDAWTVEVDTGDLVDNRGDLGLRTSVRLLPAWAVRVVEGAPLPAAPAGHVFYPLARLQRPRGVPEIQPATITDLRQGQLTMSAMERRLALMERVLLRPEFVPGRPGELPQFAPQFGPAGQPLTLNGRNFDLQPVTVRFDPVTAGDPQVTQTASVVPSPTQITLTVPAGLIAQRNYRITVTTAGGPVTSTTTFNAR
jgi:hypothetical protein